MPLPATLLSLEKATTGTFARRAIGLTARTSSDNNGPRINSAPSAIARSAAAPAPPELS